MVSPHLIAGSDYTSTTETVIFPANVNSATVTVPILDDSDFEGDERFFGMLRLSASQMGVRLGVDQADVTITDDDRKFRFSLLLIALHDSNFVTTVASISPE